MKVRICDVCNTNEANKRFKVKRSERYFDGKNPDINGYTFFRKFDICGECYYKLFKDVKTR